MGRADDGGRAGVLRRSEPPRARADAEDGKVLWQSVVGGMVMVSTVTYAVNGKQYVMMFTGEGQSLTANVLALRPR